MQGNLEENDVVIAVKVFGTDSEGKPFMQLATARNLTPERAVLDRIEHRLTPGEIVGLQHQELNTRVRVLWSCELDEALMSQVGVQLIDLRECPWRSVIATAESRNSRGPGERRRFPRQRVSIEMELSETVTGQKMRARATDLSLGGCYVETASPLPVGTRVEVEMWADPCRLSVSAVVRTCHPGVGMGMEFISVSTEKERELQNLLLSSKRRLAVVP